MRTIKFRAWDKIKGQMFVPSSLNWKEDVLWVCDVHGNTRHEFELVREHHNLMQFTGLLDKNGREVYEGDILDTRYGRMKVYDIHSLCGDINMPDEDEREIIGNIYSDPHLLNSDK